MLHLLSWRLPAAALLGLVATLAFPPYEWFLLYPLGLAGLITLTAGASPGRAFRMGFVFGLMHFVSGLYWVFISTSRYGGAPQWLGVLLVAVLSTYLALYPAVAAVVVAWARRGPITSFLLLWPSAWVFTELGRGWIGSGFPWLSGGYVLLDTALAPLAPLLGVHGLTYCTALAGGAIALLLQATRAARASTLSAAASTLALLGALVLVVPNPTHWTKPVGRTLSVGLAQGNIPQDMKWEPGALEPIQAHYLELSERLSDVRLIVWPEVAIPAPLEGLPEFFEQLRVWVREHELTLLSGVLSYPEPQVFNTIVAFSPSLPPEGQSYIKRHLVPFGEYFPMPAFLKAFMWQLEMRYSDFSSGPDEQLPIVVDGVPLGLSICFEDLFGREIRRALPQAQLLVTVTNDGWFDKSSAPAQHLQIARMRALEAGRELIRVSNRGVSAHIGADGRILNSLEFMQSGALRVEAQPREAATPYVRYGEWPAFLLAGAVLLAVLVPTWRSRRTTSIR